MHTITGDLVVLAQQGRFDVIVHGCNCFCTMGAGIAKQIKQVFPEAYRTDLETTKGDRTKLGTYTQATVDSAGQPLTIVNAYTQYNWRKGKTINADYEAIRAVFRAINRDFAGMRIGYPAIGAGLAGGDWGVIAEIISETLTEVNHTFVRYGG